MQQKIDETLRIKLNCGVNFKKMFCTFSINYTKMFYLYQKDKTVRMTIKE